MQVNAALETVPDSTSTKRGSGRAKRPTRWQCATRCRAPGQERGKRAGQEADRRQGEECIEPIDAQRSDAQQDGRRKPYRILPRE